MAMWEPVAESERLLLEASESGLDAMLAILSFCSLALPAQEGEDRQNPNRETARWPTMLADGVTCIVAFTSLEAMSFVSDGSLSTGRLTSLQYLASAWPDNTYELAINPGLPIACTLNAATLAAWAAPTIDQIHAAYPDSVDAALQQIVPWQSVADLIDDSFPTINGYVHWAGSIERFGTPSVALTALGITDPQQYLNSAGALHCLRWTAIGSDQYRGPLGGRDAQQRDAVGGWVIEDAPFVGLGFGTNRDAAIQEYHTIGTPLPHATQLWQIAPNGLEILLATYDGDHHEWEIEEWALNLAATPSEAQEAGGDEGR